MESGVETLSAQLRESVEDRTVRRHLSTPIRPDRQERHTAELACQMHEQQECRTVGPVQIVQAQEKSAVRWRPRYVQQQRAQAFK